MDVTLNSIVPVVRDLGATGVLIIVVHALWKDRTARIKEHRSIIKSKDSHLMAVNAKVLTAFEDNSESHKDLTHAIELNTQAVQNSTVLNSESLKSLSSQVLEVLKKSEK